MPDLPQPDDGSSIATAPSEEAAAGSTTDTGAPAPSDRNSLTVGADGPILLHDAHFLNQMAHFNRERIPERNVHAKGSGAFGEFETTEDVSAYTKAALFQPGVKTEMLARFSTVAGEQGSPDTWRDPRGFALKFYTTEGNYDLVGNNTPVFFVRDTDEVPALHRGADEEHRGVVADEVVVALGRVELQREARGSRHVSGEPCSPATVEKRASISVFTPG